MPCSLKHLDVATYSATTDTKVTIALSSLMGGATMDSAVASPTNGADVDYDVEGDAFTFPVLPGKTTLVMSFTLSGAHESALLYEDCGDDAKDNQKLAIIQTWNSSGFDHTLTIIGKAAQGNK